MPREGKELEELVELLESYLVTAGAIVKSPDFIPDKITGKAREVDVSIRFQVGSSHLLVIVECRDRLGNEDVTWIEQLAQKRNDIGADKAVAVSSFGFSEEAIIKANAHGIETRLVQEITPEFVREWFAPDGLALQGFSCAFRDVSIQIDHKSTIDGRIELGGNLAERMARFDQEDRMFVWRKDGNKYCLADIWQMLPRFADIDEIYKGIPSDGTKVTRRFQITFPDRDIRFQIIAESGCLEVSRILIVAELWIESTSVPINKSYSYKNQDQAITEAIVFEETRIDGTKANVSLHRNIRTGDVGAIIQFGKVANETK